MNLFRIMEKDFVLVRESWTMGQARSVCGSENASRVILWDADFYLIDHDDFLRLIRDLDPEQRLRDLARARGLAPTPAIDGWLDAKQVLDRVVILLDGAPAGYFDMSIPASPRVKREAGPICLLAGDLPGRIAVDQDFSLLVKVIGGGEPSSVLPMDAELDIVVVARIGLETTARSEGVLRFESDDDPLPIQFKLRGTRPGLGTVRVYAFFQGQAVSVLNLSLSIHEREEVGEVVRRDEYEALVRPSAIAQPDLTLLILEQSHAQLSFTIIANGGDPGLDLNFVKYGPILLHDPGLFTDQLFGEIKVLPWHRPDEWRSINGYLEDKGARVGEMLLPLELRDRIWALRDRLKSIFVLSEEPWIPWELCRLNDPAGKAPGFFLSDRFWLTRWTPGLPNRLNLNLRTMALIVSGTERGGYLRQEEKLIKLFRGEHREIKTIPSDFYQVRNALASGVFQGWHFAGHARLNQETNLECDLVFDDQKSLSPSDLSGSLTNMGRSQPLVFMNCCHTARQEKVFSGMIGWPKQCLQAGAGAFVGTLWPIADQPAYQFAEAFYSQLFNRRPLGEVGLNARLALKKIGNPAWLTYSVYAHPFAIEGKENG